WLLANARWRPWRNPHELEFANGLPFLFTDDAASTVPRDQIAWAPGAAHPRATLFELSRPVLATPALKGYLRERADCGQVRGILENLWRSPPPRPFHRGVMRIRLLSALAARYAPQLGTHRGANTSAGMSIDGRPASRARASASKASSS